MSAKGYIYKDVDGNGKLKLPVTHSDAVYFSDGYTLTEKSSVHNQYVTLAESPMTSADATLFTTGGTWTYDANGATPSAIGEETYIYCNRLYHCDMRIMRIRVLMGLDTKLMLPTTGERTYGASCFGVDFAAKKIIIYPALPFGTNPGTGDEMRGTNGFTTDSILEYTTIPDSMIGAREYIVEVERNAETHYLRLYDTLTAQTVEVSHTGIAAGHQNERYKFYCASGTLPTLSDFSVRAINEPDVVFVGDSVTEGDWCINRLNSYANRFRRKFPDLKVMISARSGSKLVLHAQKWISEFNLYRPKIISLFIGLNGGNTEAGLQTFKDNCDAIGCKLIVHHVNIGVDINADLDSWGFFNGAYFDVATSLNNDPTQGKNPLYYESEDAGVHPNELGHGAMFDRFIVDCADLWYNS